MKTLTQDTLAELAERAKAARTAFCQANSEYTVAIVAYSVKKIFKPMTVWWEEEGCKLPSCGNRD